VTVIVMTDQDFDYVRKLLRERCALVLEPGKEYLVETRLSPIVRQLNLASLSDLVARVRSEPANGLVEQIVEAMVTTETSFFRDRVPFEEIRKHVLPSLIERRHKERALRIWCAACATGQEPYSLAILIKEHFPELARWDIQLLASDLSRQVLARAAEGRYNQIEANRGLPATLLVKYFEQHGTTWQLRADVRGMVAFREINLDRELPALPLMDLVLVRNVMIYFDVDTKKAILGRMARVLRKDGYLLLGGAETTYNLDASFRRVEQLKTAFYQLAD
jgi:chemotaxis protein methyltransferase CheR